MAACHFAHSHFIYCHFVFDTFYAVILSLVISPMLVVILSIAFKMIILSTEKSRLLITLITHTLNACVSEWQVWAI
jgi:hypothetical protein